MAARTDKGFDRLVQLAELLQSLSGDGDVRIIGTSIVTRSGRVGWSGQQQKWVAARYPRREPGGRRA